MFKSKKKNFQGAETNDDYAVKRIAKRSKCYDCNNELNKESHKVTLREKVRFFCTECYFEMIERMRREKVG